MLKVNLLPEEHRKTPLSRIEQLHRTPLMWIIAGSMTALPVLVWMPIGIREQQLRQLSSKIAVLEPKKKAVDDLQQNLRLLKAQDEAFKGLAKGEDLWAPRLNTLSDVTPEGVWFTELTLEPNKGLELHGSAVKISNSPGMANVTRFVQQLKADPTFASVAPQIGSIRQVQEGETEIVQFTLTCPMDRSMAPAK